MNTIGLFKKLLTLKPLYHFDIEVENPDEEEAAYFFKECERRGLVPKWLDTETPTIRVTNCAGTSRLQKAIARLNTKDMSHIHGLIVAAGISTMMKSEAKHQRKLDRNKAINEPKPEMDDCDEEDFIMSMILSTALNSSGCVVGSVDNGVLTIKVGDL